jgi:hypothetical protein
MKAQDQKRRFSAAEIAHLCSRLDQESEVAQLIEALREVGKAALCYWNTVTDLPEMESVSERLWQALRAVDFCAEPFRKQRVHSREEDDNEQ